MGGTELGLARRLILPVDEACGQICPAVPPAGCPTAAARTNFAEHARADVGAARRLMAFRTPGKHWFALNALIWRSMRPFPWCEVAVPLQTAPAHDVQRAP
ncbi:MAG: hypothetical protein Devi2KO_39200 [Devosia indica]